MPQPKALGEMDTHRLRAEALGGVGSRGD